MSLSRYEKSNSHVVGCNQMQRVLNEIASSSHALACEFDYRRKHSYQKLNSIVKRRLVSVRAAALLPSIFSLLCLVVSLFSTSFVSY